MRDLAIAMGTSRPIYSLHPFENGQPIHRDSIQETVKIYYQRLIDFFPQGPYLLLGYSAMGIITIELARLLQKEGKKVAFLGLLDTYPPGSRQRVVQTDRIKYHLTNLRNKTLFGFLEYLGISIKRELTRWWQTTINFIIIERYKQKEKIVDYRRMLLNTYRPEPFDGEVTLFSADDRPSYIHWDPKEEWVNIFTGPFEVVSIKGDHLSILKPPLVSFLADKILEILRRNEIE